MNIDAWLLSVTCWLLGVQRRRLEARMTSAFDAALSLKLDAFNASERLLREVIDADDPRR